MPSAQPADPARRYVHNDVNEPDDAAVLPLNPRRSRGALRTVRGRWSHMGIDQPARHLHTADEPDASRHDDVPAVAAFANTIETSFLEIDQSLTNPQTAAAFQRTLDLWERILQGSHAQHVIDDAQLDQLLETLNGMRQAPNLI